eukprot:TRINITY_DN6126_c0_g2_i1.p1 TRINITY_DN6126_c0_g2~~TRINITY_DN6126_c0_g2_i1.p1  ORF type:complete len:794 (+),score=319.19 TRINITY_DN6126_c0_g2_i1:38-2383(+)
MMMRALCVASAVACAVGQSMPQTTEAYDTRACRPGYDHFQFCNTSLTREQRLDALQNLVTDEEMIPFMTARSSQIDGVKNNITRLGVPHYDWGLNCIHGVQSSCVVDAVTNQTYCPTSFPAPVNFGATFNKGAFLKLGQVLGLETRAMWLAGAVEPKSTIRVHIGLDCWSPNININHDPRWGRNQEVPSEDPLVNGLFGTLYTQGMQNSADETRFLQGITTLKHWDAYTLEDAEGQTRHTFNALVDNATFADTFFPAWKESITNGKAAGVMCSYNAINGVPTCASPMLNKALRDVWGFQGYITSDSGAIRDIYMYHKYVDTPAKASCAAVKDGQTDVDSGSVYYDSLLEGVQLGYCEMSDVTRSWRHAMGLLFDMGLFDPVEDQPLWKVPLKAVATEESNRTSEQISMESMVLLKNDNVLPLPAGKKYAVLGPHYAAQSALVGNYLGQLCPDTTLNCIETLEAAVKRVSKGTVVSAAGCDVNTTDTSGFDAALSLIDGADAVILAIGLDNSVSNEGDDRTSIALPGVQSQLVSQVIAKAAESSTPVVLVLINGGMVSLGKDVIASANGIVEAFYPGFFGASAVAATLFGENDRLGGKMPYTVYPAEYTQQVNMSLMSMNARGTPGRSYKYYTGETEFEFGFGLSYTTFSLSAQMEGDAPTCADHTTGGRVVVTVKNTGAVTGDNVIFFYVMGGTTGTGLPVVKKLVGFERVHLANGADAQVELALTADLFLDVEENGDHTCRPAVRTLRVSDGIASQDLSVHVGGSTSKFFSFPDVPPRRH